MSFKTIGGLMGGLIGALAGAVFAGMVGEMGVSLFFELIAFGFLLVIVTSIAWPVIRQQVSSMKDPAKESEGS